MLPQWEWEHQQVKQLYGNNVSVTVSFGEAVKGAQFKLSYDTSKFDYVSCSAGTLGASNTYVYADLSGGQAKISSVTFTFKAKAIGTGKFSISNIVLPVSYTTASSSTSITVEAAKNTNSNTNKKPTTSTNKKKPTTNNKNNNKEQEPEQEPETIEKNELYSLIQELGNLEQTDYTEASWNELQDLINKAEAASTSEEYNEVKDKLNIEGLVPETFEKSELDKVLRLLIGKLEKDYTAESWTGLMEAIDTADSAVLKSEYDAIKGELTINNLVLEEDKGFIGELIEKMKEDPYILGLVISIAVLLIIVFILIIICIRKGKNKESGFTEERDFGRRFK